MGIIRESFIILKNWGEAINTLPEEYQLETYKALVEYGTTGKMPDNVSAICKAMLISFSKDMERNIEKYSIAVQNGQKGGAPKGNQNAKKKEKNEEKNKDNTEQSKTTENNQKQPTYNQNQAETSKNKLYVNVNDNVNVNVNDISQSNKEENNVFSSSYTHTCEGERVSYKTKEEREEYLVLFKDVFDTLTGSFKDAGLEIIDTLLEAREIACTFEGLKFNHKSIGKISFDEMVKHLEPEKFREIAGQLALNAEIKNRPYYILGCLVNAYDEYLNKRRRKPYEIIE